MYTVSHSQARPLSLVRHSREIVMQSSLCRTDYFCMHVHSPALVISTPNPTHLVRTSLALKTELSAACGGHGSPVLLVGRLTVVTNAIGLPWLIESLEVEEVNVPG